MKKKFFGKEDVNIFLFTEDVITYIENPVDSTNKLQERNEFKRVEGYQIDI